MADYCACGSLKFDGLCSNYISNCSLATRKKPVKPNSQGYARNKSTGVLMDKETGTSIEGRRIHYD